MVSNGQITGMILAILVPMIVVCALFVYMKRHVRMKGFIIVFFFGVAGFIWQAFIKSYIIAFAVTPLGQSDFFREGFGLVCGQAISSLLDAAFVALALVWALYFCNLRDIELKRAPMIGLGFGCAYAIMNYIVRYAPYLVRAFKIRGGTFDGTEQEIQEVQSLTVENMYLFILSCVLYILVIVGVTLVMGFFHRSHSRGRTFFAGMIPSFFIGFLNVLFPLLMPDVVSAVIYNVLLALVACYAMWITTGFYRTGKLMFTKKKAAEDFLPQDKDGKGQKNTQKSNFAYAGNKKKHK
ncbi:MAG: hypothetical protein VZQ83_02740 [Eubacterium sp.]|nr:hypothetical protein [Eubacterium sp.]